MANLAIWRPQERASWLRGFPDSIYDTTPATHLARLMNALCGDPGVGRVRKELMLKRAQTELDATRFYDLDNVYSALFDFPRLESETYSVMPSDLMTWAEWQDAQVKDAHYRRRIRKYMEAFMWGGTRRGVELCVEAACGCDAEAFSADEFYEACGVRDADELYDTVHGLQRGMQVGVEPTDDMAGVSYADDSDSQGGRVSDFSEYVVVAMRDDPVTSEELLLAHRALSRVAPDHARAVVISRRELSSRMVLDGCDEAYVPIRGVQASSSWWNVTRTVTGRMDWEYRKYPHLWVKPGVPVEAPRQALVLSQEESFDMTPLAVSAQASTCHEGKYGRLMAALFSDITETTQETEPMCAVSRSSNRRYTASFYGGTDVVDWSYPVEYIPELDRRFSELARSARWWSSEESKSGTEYVEVYLKRVVPLNRVSLSVSQKPVRVVPYYSSGVDANGDRVWCRALSSDGSPMAHSVRTWGGSSVGSSFVGVDFETMLVEADAVRVEFERLDVPYRETRQDGSKVEERPAYSVDVRDLSVMWDVLSRQDCRDAVFEDPFGNKLETGVREMLPEGLLDGDPETYWCSQPNVSPNAVEWLVMDVRDDSGGPQRIGFLDIEAVYEGARMNVYSSDDAEEWVPYPEPFELRSGRVDLPDRRASFIKLEFTLLCGVPYSPVTDGIRVRTLEFPPSEVSYAASLKTESSSMSRTERLLTSPDDLAYDNAGVYDVLGAPDIYSRNDSPLQGAQRRSAFLFTSDAYRSRDWSQVSGAYGDDMAVESNMTTSYRTVPTVRQDGSYVRLMFHETGRHRYRVNWHERKYDAAFVVGIKSIRAGYGGQNLHARPGEPFVVQMGDSNMVGDADQWELVDGERMVPSTSKALCTLQTQDLQTVVPFRAFDFATNQRMPDQVFEHPSDMSREWHGTASKAYRDEFGVSGTVLHAERGESGFGVESEGKLVCANGVARFEAEVFPSQVGDDVETSDWTVECRDQFGEQVYSMTYSCESGQWTKMGCVFTPQPGGGWWDLSYAYRMRVPLMGPVEEGSHVFVPFVDVDAIRKLDGVRDDLADLRLVRHSGTETSEIPYDMTDNMELWFRCAQGLSAGQQANGYFERSTGVFTDAYYVYFGNAHETSPSRDSWRDVFDHTVEASGDAAFGESGATLSKGGGIGCDGVPMPAGGGFASMWLELSENLSEVPDGSEGIADVRYLLDMEDDDGTRVSAYLFERQLVLSVRDADGFESSAVTADGELERAGLVRGARRLVLLTWGAQGSASTYVDGAVDASGSRRRRCEVRVGSPEPLRLVPNVYDEKSYSGGLY